jgi:hypothetical protein
MTMKPRAVPMAHGIDDEPFFDKRGGPGYSLCNHSGCDVRHKNKRSTITWRSMIWPVVDPLQTAIGTFQRVINVIEARIPCARVRFGQGHFVVKMRMIRTETTPARRACTLCVFVTKPALHGSLPSLSEVV